MGTAVGRALAAGISWQLFARSVLVGAGGCLVLLFFLTTFLHFYAVIKFMPWVIAFNAAVAGFQLAGKGTARSSKRLKLVSTGAGLLVALLTTLVFVVAAWVFVGEAIVTLADMLIFSTVGVGCCLLGAILAQKYSRLN